MLCFSNSGLKKFGGYLGFVDLRATALNTRGPGLAHEIADLVVEGWLVEIEIRAARMPD